MQNIKVGRYKNPQAVGYAGWIDGESWIAFVDLDGRATVHLDRDETGAVNVLPSACGAAGDGSQGS
jgi:hypothetical protein